MQNQNTMKYHFAGQSNAINCLQAINTGRILNKKRNPVSESQLSQPYGKRVWNSFKKLEIEPYDRNPTVDIRSKLKVRTPQFHHHFVYSRNMEAT